MKRIVYFLFFFLAFSLFWNTDISNRTEADDAFEYAYQVEHNGLNWLYHPHHLLYGAVTKDLYNGAKLLGYRGRAYPMLRLISALCGAGSVLVFFRFCYRRFSMRPVSSLLCSGLLLFSYGFWRYADEAEVVVPACLAMLVALYLSVKPSQSGIDAAVAGLVCGVSILFHVLNVIPVFLAVPLFYLLQKNWRGLLLNLMVAVLVTGLGYFGVYWFETSQVFDGNGVSVVWQWTALWKGLVGFSQCIASSNFMLGYDSIRELLVKMFPSRMLLEEIYMGQRIPFWVVVSASISLVMLVFCMFGVAGWALYSLMKKSTVRRRDRLGVVDDWRTLAVTVVWFISYAAAVLLLEPGNPEVWVMGLVPFWLVFCGLIVAPLSRQNCLWPVLLLVFLLGGHNYLGGVYTLKNSKGDYNRQKAAWSLKQARPGDVILTAGNPVFERYLRYYCPAKIEYLYFWHNDWVLHPQIALQVLRTEQRTGTIYVLGDVFMQPESLKRRFPERTQVISRFSEDLRPVVEKIHDDEFGGVYKLTL
ncbi:MAG: hypothetical protein AB7E95_03305 [Kiritimatiellales bacterium]